MLSLRAASQAADEARQELNLDDAQSLESAADGIAGSVPEDLKNAVRAYVSMRKIRLAAGLERAASYQAEDIRRRVRALDELAGLLDLDQGEHVVPDERPAPGVPQDEHRAWLADVLTPPGWDQTGGLLEIVEEWQKEAEETLAKAENDDARARQAEAVWCQRFLRTVSRRGTRSRGMLQSRAERLGGEVVNGRRATAAG